MYTAADYEPGKTEKNVAVFRDLYMDQAFAEPIASEFWTVTDHSAGEVRAHQVADIIRGTDRNGILSEDDIIDITVCFFGTLMREGRVIPQGGGEDIEDEDDAPVEVDLSWLDEIEDIDVNAPVDIGMSWLDEMPEDNERGA